MFNNDPWTGKFLLVINYLQIKLLQAWITFYQYFRLIRYSKFTYPRSACIVLKWNINKIPVILLPYSAPEMFNVLHIYNDYSDITSQSKEKDQIGISHKHDLDLGFPLSYSRQWRQRRTASPAAQGWQWYLSPIITWNKAEIQFKSINHKIALPID